MSSFIDGMTYTRGPSADWDRLASYLGDSSWSWSRLQSYFRKVRTVNSSTYFHGLTLCNPSTRVFCSIRMKRSKLLLALLTTATLLRFTVPQEPSASPSTSTTSGSSLLLCELLPRLVSPITTM